MVFCLFSLGFFVWFFFPIVTWCQHMNKDGNDCSVGLSPTCGHKYPVTVAGRSLNLVNKSHEEHIRKPGPFLVCTPLQMGKQGKYRGL